MLTLKEGLCILKCGVLVGMFGTGVGLSISSFLLLLLEDFGLQLQHLTPHSLLLTSIFVHL